MALQDGFLRWVTQPEFDRTNNFNRDSIIYSVHNKSLKERKNSRQHPIQPAVNKKHEVKAGCALVCTGVHNNFVLLLSKALFLTRVVMIIFCVKYRITTDSRHASYSMSSIGENILLSVPNYWCCTSYEQAVTIAVVVW